MEVTRKNCRVSTEERGSVTRVDLSGSAAVE
jgi:hypothetical protein